MKNIVILGSTGSIGTQTLDIIRNNKDALNVTALAAGSNAELIEAQIREFRPKVAVLFDISAAARLKDKVADTPCRVLCGMDGLIEAASLEEADTVVGAMVGMIGIRPTIAAIRAGKDIALANKETLVCAGHIIMSLAKENHVRILPVDSEHSAIFQSLHGENRAELEKILLTASGGPFRGMDRDRLKNMTCREALKHPNWNMGPKVTIDSATLVNKGLEVMEAHWLFDVDIDDIEVIVHPQSIIHSMVQYRDGSIKAQLGTPDMHLPIQYALFYPERRYLGGKRVDFFELKGITFERPDLETFTGLKLALEAARRGGSMPTVFNSANEAAVRLFLKSRITFTAIPEIIREAMDNSEFTENPDVDDILTTEAETLEFVNNNWKE